MAPTAGDILFVDTNVLLTATDQSRPQHRDAGRLIGESGRHGLHLAASGQILREYLVVATRPPDTNGLGLQVRDAATNVNEFLRFIHLYDETEEVSGRLRQLGLIYDLHGKRLHDANIVATMSVHGIRVLVTQNPDDFAPFEEIDLVAVADIATRSQPLSLGRNPSRPVPTPRRRIPAPEGQTRVVE